MAESPARAARKPKSPSPRRALVEEQVRQKAAAVFAANGYANTSLGDIADALGTGRTALYHYYANKDDLFIALMRESAQQAHQVLREWLAFDENRSPAERLREAVRALAIFAMRRPQQVRLLDTVTGIPPHAAAEARRRNRAFFRDLQALIRQGIEAGELRTVDEGVAAHTIVGSTRSLAWWFEADGPRSPEFIAAQLADTSVAGLAADGQASVDPRIRGALSTIQSGLDALQETFGSR